MINKKIIILAIFLVGLLVIGTATAADIANENNATGAEPDSALSATNDNEKLEINENNNVLTASPKTLTDLNNTINGNSNKTIDLYDNYAYNDGTDNAFKEGIVIGHEVSIDGHGIKIDGLRSARIFKINTNDKVTFKNITFTHGNVDGGDGGAIYGSASSSSSYTAINCTFSGNSAFGDGGAMWGGTAIGCTFSGNSALGDGGAMWGGTAIGCTFSRNHVDFGDGDAMYWGSEYLCIFENYAADCYFTNQLSGVSASLSVSNTVFSEEDEKRLTVYLTCEYQGEKYRIDNFNAKISILQDGAWNDLHVLTGQSSVIDLQPGVYLANFTVKATTSEVKRDGVQLKVTDGTTFSDLNKIINGNTANEIDLYKNYKYNSTTDSEFRDGIIIDREVSIDGHGITIDGSWGARIFKINTNDKVTFKNITFTHGNVDGGDGGAIYGSASSSYTMINCTFSGNTAVSSGAMFSGTAIGCTFSDNMADNGGAICDGTAIGCTFSGNTANYGGAMFDGTAIGCTFTGNTADYGDAMYYGSEYLCIFENYAADCYYTDQLPGVSASLSVSNTVFSEDEKSLTVYLTCEYQGEKYQIDNFNAKISILQNGAWNDLHVLTGQSSVIDLQPGVYLANFTVKATTSEVKRDGVQLKVTDGTTFSDLNRTINGNTNDTITLDKNYTFNSTTDHDFIDGIVVNRQVTINGNGCTINANGKARIFQVNFNDGVLLNDINFINGNTAGNGGAVNFVDRGNVTNCNFTGNNATSRGGAICCNAVCFVTNCNFINNNATLGNGGALWAMAAKVVNCNFTDNFALHHGGACWIYSGIVSGSDFIGNDVVTGSGGALRFTEEGDVTNCNFTNNSAIRGGAVGFNGKGDLTNCNFNNNRAISDYGGAAYFYFKANVTNCSFADNEAATYGGAVFFDSFANVTNCNFVSNKVASRDGGAVCFNSSGALSNCNFAGNSAGLRGGAVYFYINSTVENCNFTGNTASNGGAIHTSQMCYGIVAGCDFANNSAFNGGAVNMYAGVIEDCNFANNTATNAGGAVIFSEEGCLAHCNFEGNTAFIGGAISMFSGNLNNCNFTGNNATKGSAINFNGFSGTNISNSLFLNNRANASATDAFNVTVNGNSVVIAFIGQNNLLNAIYSKGNISFTNVTYWGAGGFVNTGADLRILSPSSCEAGLNISVIGVVNGNIINATMTSDENGRIVLEDGSDYYLFLRHDEDSYYTEAEKIISKMKFNVNVTSQTTYNRIVNITAKSNIYSEVMTGKLLFILPNSEEISANYGGNGTWWAVHTFDDYGVYEVNASYTGLDNVTVNNGTITINKPDSTIMLDDITLNYGESKNVTVTTTGATEITASINGTDVTVINNYTIPISGLAAGNYTLNVTTVPDGDHNSVSKEVKIIVYKATAEITVDSATMDIKVLDEVLSGATLTPADAGNLTYKSNNETVVIVKDGKIKALAKGTATITVSFAGNENYTATKNKTINVTVNLKDAIISVNNSTLDLFVGDNFTVVATTTPAGLNVTFVQDDSGVYIVDGNGNVTALKEGTGHILVKVGGDGVYAENTTEITVSVSKIPTEITLTNTTLDLKVNEMVDGLANLTPADAGNLTFISSDENIVFVADGTILARSKGNATVTVSFAGNEKYEATLNRTIHVNVSLNDASVSVENSTLELKVDERYDLNATAVPRFLNVEYVSSNESVATVTDYGIVTAVGEGTTTIALTVGNDMTYAVNTTNVTVTVSKIPTEITVDITPLDLFVGDEIVIVANLTPAGAGNVTFTSSDYDVVDFDFEGNVIAQGKGQAIITVSFAGDDKYAAAENKTIIINVSLDNASVTVDNNTLDLKVGETSAINATKHPDTIMLDITYTSSNNSVATVDKNGIVTAVGEGTAVITVEVGDDEIYAKNSTTVNVTVSKVSTEIESSAVTTVYNVDKNLIVTLKDANGKPIRGANITVDLNGEKTYTTDEKGQVTVSTKGLAPKSYTAKITFNGNSKYDKSTKNVKVTVKKATPKITAKAKTFKTTTKTKKYSIVLKNNVNKPIKKATVYLKVNGKTYKATTNSKGKATFKITKLNKAGKFKATVTYKGNKYYNKATKKVTIKVKSVWKTVSKGSKNSAIVKKIQRALKNNGYYLEYNGRYLMVDGIFWDYTEMAVKEFQNDKVLKVTGKVDEKTAKKLGII